MVYASASLQLPARAGLLTFGSSETARARVGPAGAVY
jgi:hypothetical protein